MTKQYKGVKVNDGTTKKSLAAETDMWFVRNVRQGCDGFFGWRTMYFATVDSATSALGGGSGVADEVFGGHS